METMFIEFQTYMMKSTNELRQSLQANKKPSSTNVARLSYVYDEATNSVAKSNTSHKTDQKTFPDINTLFIHHK